MHLTPIEMDFIEFKNWNSKTLEFTCHEVTEWDKYYIMEYNDETETIKIKKRQITSAWKNNGLSDK